MKILSRRPVFQGSLVLFFAMLILAGIARDDIRTVVSNATILCFSCIGLK